MMKEYPSIPKASKKTPQIKMHTWDKLDGSNLRFEWSKKQGWHKFGTRTRLIDAQMPIFGHAIPLFQETLADPLEKIARDNRWESVTVFCEFWGDKSFVGWREVYQNQGDLYPDDTRNLSIIDVAPYKKGILAPREFLKLFDHLSIPAYLGEVNWTRGFVERVRNDEVEGVSFEGVVGKGGEGFGLKMSKAKTQKWVDAVLALCGENEGRKLVES